MCQLIKQRNLFRLLLAFVAVEIVRHNGWMVFYEQFVDNTREEINTGFILYSAVIFIAALLIPYAYKKLDIVNKPAKLRTVFIVSLCIAFLLRMLQLAFGLMMAYLLLTLWTIAIMLCVCICFISIYNNVPMSHIGRFFGIAYFADTIIISFIEHFSGTSSYYIISLLIGIILCISALITTPWRANESGQSAAEEKVCIPSARYVYLALAALVLYVLLAGMIDNLYFFDDWLELPPISQFSLPITSTMYLLCGILFDKMRLRTTLPLAFVSICVAQAMLYFASESVFAHSYSLFSSLGSTFLELATLIFPIIYARTSKHGYVLAASGEGLFYGGFCATSILFMFVKQTAYRHVMGIILIGSIISLLLVIKVIALYHRHKHQQEIEQQRLAITALELKAEIADSEALTLCPQPELNLELGLTKREKELLPLIASSFTAEEIAHQTNVSVSTIRFHIKNVLRKAEASNRRELIRLLAGQIDMSDKATNNNE
ncbi:helix-turn-helix transcriptional regulator [Oscillibacter sp.]|uniref:helix-turn-helix transcriptional regulator n=1 Tax=Oscillibacter sp. TaxID=1945593 RepID=UPI0028A257D3|nr:helix-turn-helix transcriptional regulator [Oscillibacter sp.]